MIWQDMLDKEKDNISAQYENIRKQIKSLNAIKANNEKKRKYCSAENEKYNNEIIKLQEQYNNIEVYYRCDYCNNEIKLSLDKIKTLIKNNAKPIFCNRKCSGIYYANKSHEGKTEEEIQTRKAKISKTLKAREINLSEEEKIIRYNNLHKYWKNMTSEERSSRNRDFVSKTKETKLKKYGNANYNNIDKIKQTNLELYKVENAFRTNKAIAKAKEANQEKYGVDYFFSNREEFIKRSIEKYGTEHPMQNREVKEKLSNTKFINWGDSNYNNQTKFEKTFLKRYGVRRPFHIKKFKDKSNETKLKRYGNSNYNNREKALKTLYERYGKNYYEKQLSNIGNRISKINKKFAEYIGTDTFEFPIGKFSYDIKINNTLIEIDPSFTHNCCENKLFGRFGSLDKDYHFKKSRTAIENNYQCIHVFDWDNWEKIKYLLQDKQTLYARNLEIKEVSIEDTTEFLNAYHLQNTCKGQTIRLGLYKDNKLIEIMTFGKPRYNKNYEWELLRLCTHKDYKVVGGAEKLFKHFISELSPKSIISYCDFSKFTGEVYTRLGFKQKGSIVPSKHWCKGEQHITDNLLRQRGYDQLFSTNYGKGTSNEELMLENGWLPIYDCGQLTFIWNKCN